jgi:UDP-glucose 4-epimerase
VNFDFYEGKTCLVTGGAGFIGSHLVDSLVKLKANVVVLDNFLTGKGQNLKQSEKTKNFKLIRGDVRDFGLLASLTQNCDIIFHMAAGVVGHSSQNPRRDMEINIEGTFNILEAALGRQGYIHKVVYASSASVYGNSRQPLMSEDGPTNPLSAYATSKLAGEHYCRVFYDYHDVPTVALRYFNIYGPRQTEESGYGGVVSIFAKCMMKGEPLPIFGDGSQTRDFSYIDDAIHATLLAGMSNIHGEVFNIGTGLETSIDDLAQIMLDLGSKYSKPIRREVRYTEKRIIDNVRRRVADIEKARYLLRYEPVISLRDGLTRVLEYYGLRGAKPS